MVHSVPHYSGFNLLRIWHHTRNINIIHYIDGRSKRGCYKEGSRETFLHQSLLGLCSSALQVNSFYVNWKTVHLCLCMFVPFGFGILKTQCFVFWFLWFGCTLILGGLPPDVVEDKLCSMLSSCLLNGLQDFLSKRFPMTITYGL